MIPPTICTFNLPLSYWTVDSGVQNASGFRGFDVPYLGNMSVELGGELPVLAFIYPSFAPVIN